MELYDYEKQHLQYLRSHLAECTVLLKTNGAFPLEKPGQIAAYGCGVRNTVKGGTGSGEVNSRFFVNVEEGLEAAGFEITTKKWLDDYDIIRAEARTQFVRDVKAQAKAKGEIAMFAAMGAVMPEPNHDLPLDGQGDVAIYVLSRISGEGNDRMIEGDFKLTASEKRDILALNSHYEKFMLVINAGGPVDLSDVTEVGNILVMSQLGVESGSALADILLGRQNPSGKLTTTWSAWEDYCPVGDFGGKADTRYTEGIYVGYRYFDSVGNKALFPFGYGTSYTTFDTRFDSASADGEVITVKATVTNTGNYPGKEVVQVYLSAPTVKLDKPYQDLAGFAKTAELAPGDSQQVTVTFKLRDLASYDELLNAYVLEGGNYILRVGSSSVHTSPAAMIVLDEEAIVAHTKRACGDPGFADWKPAPLQTEQVHANIPILFVKASQIRTCVFTYDSAPKVEDLIKGLSDEQLAYLNTGAAASSAGVLSVIGNASALVAGAAGESSGLLKDQGILPLVMADGPAGLRLSRQFYRDDKGVHAIGQLGLPESMVEMLPSAAQWLLKKLGTGKKLKDGTRVEYQYCTALPIGTALAQSWNTEFAEGCGDIVGAEMERFGVHLWLAPALNIHRSVLCGRNFEYFSEDPLISGKMAAALTVGVQKHPGCGTTIKHYCANNQETNRYTNNSLVSPRALREIYLRGFEICVRESQPCALMSSYNLLNGEHTSERRGLVEDILRSEWGYDGIVMTDWLISAMPADKASPHRKPNAGLIAASGHELVMPGDKVNVKEILAALKNGTLTREQLEINASRLYRMTQKLYQK